MCTPKMIWNPLRAPGVAMGQCALALLLTGPGMMPLLAADDSYTPIFVTPPEGGEAVETIPTAETIPLDVTEDSAESVEVEISVEGEVSVESLQEQASGPETETGSTSPVEAPPVDETPIAETIPAVADSAAPADAQSTAISPSTTEPSVEEVIELVEPDSATQDKPVADSSGHDVEIVEEGTGEIPEAASPASAVAIPPSAVVTRDVEFTPLLPREMFEFQAVFYPLWSAGYTDYRANAVCEYREELVKAGEQLAKAPIFEMTKADFDSWRTTTKGLLKSVLAVNEACSVEDGRPLPINLVNDRFIATRDLWVTLLKIRRE